MALVNIVECETVPWMARVVFNYNNDMVCLLREIPGAIWDPAVRCWVVPVDTLCIIVDAFVQDDYEVHIGEELVRYVQGENVDMEEYEIVSQGN